MEDYNKIIESLNIRFKKARNINILQPLTIENYYDVENTIILPNNGEVKYGRDRKVVGHNEVLFIPGGKLISLTYGSGNAVSLSNDDFINNKEKYFQQVNGVIEESTYENFSYMSFDAKVFEAVNFFASLDIQPFVISNNNKIINLMKDLSRETYSENPGKDRMIKVQTEMIVIEVIRHLLQKNMFVEQLATNVTYFKDPRLIDIFAYIKDNLNEDLSNKVLANVANVSEDYVGQYFKMLTGINPQDYIEYQRMELAVNLLRTSKKSIRDIGKDVGYKDTAYFCRRFKMMFGIPAGKMRRRESLMNV